MGAPTQQGDPYATNPAQPISADSPIHPALSLPQNRESEMTLSNGLHIRERLAERLKKRLAGGARPAHLSRPSKREQAIGPHGRPLPTQDNTGNLRSGYLIPPKPNQ